MDPDKLLLIWFDSDHPDGDGGGIKLSILQIDFHNGYPIGAIAGNYSHFGMM
jgi:hypothetical protein